MSSFAERLDSLRSPPKQSDLSLSRELGVSNSLLRKYLRGANPGLDNLLRIARAKKVYVQWLATGEGPRHIQPEVALSLIGTEQEQTVGEMRQIQRAMGPRTGMVMLPRLSIKASAGQGIAPEGEETEGFMAFKAEFLRDLGINPSNAHVLMIKGDSMYPTLRDRDIIIIDASVIEALEEGLYTLVLGDVVKAKRLQPLANGGVRIISDNKAESYADEIVDRSEREGLRIVGRIRGVYRNF